VCVELLHGARLLDLPANSLERRARETGPAILAGLRRRLIRSRSCAAVDDQRVAGDERGCVAGQEQRSVRDVFRLPHVRIGLEFREYRVDFFLVVSADAKQNRSRDAARCDAIHPDAIAGELERCTAREVHDPGFGRAVGKHACRAFEAADR